MFSRSDLTDLVEAAPSIAVFLYLPMQVLGRETHLARATHRIIVVADAEIGGHVLKDEARAPLIAGFVEVNPAALDEAAIHAAAAAVMKPIHDQSRDAALGPLDALIGRGDATACTDRKHLNAAAQDGRVEQLFVAEHQGLSRLPDTRTGPAEGIDPAIRNDQERAAQSTLRNGGAIWVVPPDRLPEGTRMAAVLRFEADKVPQARRLRASISPFDQFRREICSAAKTLQLHQRRQFAAPC
jgi:hypothetical protein